MINTDTQIKFPTAWAETKLKDIVKLFSGFAFKSKEYTNQGIPILRMGNIRKNFTLTFDKPKQPYFPKLRIKEFENFLLNPDDIVITLTDLSTKGEYLGTVAKLGKDQHALLNQRVSKVIVSKHLYQPFLFYLLQGPNFRNYVTSDTTGSLQKNTNHKFIYEFSCSIAPINEQKRIVSKIEELLTKLDAGVESLKQVQILLKKYRQSVLKSAVEGKLTSEWRKQHKDKLEPADKLLERILNKRKEKWEAEQLANFKAKGKKPPKHWQNKYKETTPPDTSDLPELPEGWMWCKLSQVTHLITKGSSPRWQGFDYVDKGIMFIRSQNVGWGELIVSDVAHLPKDFNKKQKKSILKSGDVLLNIVGASIGRAAIATEETENANINQAVATIRLFKNGLLNTFLMNYLISADAQSAIHSKAVDVARANFSLTDISDLIVPLPPQKEQAKISAEIDRLSTIIEKTEQFVLNEIKRSQSLRKSILKQAFEGKLVAQDPNDEPASVLLKRIKAEKANLKN